MTVCISGLHLANRLKLVASRAHFITKLKPKENQECTDLASSLHLLSCLAFKAGIGAEVYLRQIKSIVIAGTGTAAGSGATARANLAAVSPARQQGAAGWHTQGKQCLPEQSLCGAATASCQAVVWCSRGLAPPLPAS